MKSFKLIFALFIILFSLVIKGGEILVTKASEEGIEDSGVTASAMVEDEILIKYKKGTPPLSLDYLKNQLTLLENKNLNWKEKIARFLTSKFQSSSLLKILKIFGLNYQDDLISETSKFSDILERIEKAKQIEFEFNERIFHDKTKIYFPKLTPQMLEKEGINYKKAQMALEEINRWQLIKFKQKISFDKAKEIFEKIPGVEKVSPNYKLFIDERIPNDEFYHTKGSWGQNFDDLWGLKAIKGSKAWGIETGSSSIIIAVVDTGVDSGITMAYHPELEGKLLPGWNFERDNEEARDDHGHGTHVAGTIAALSDNQIGVASVCWNCKILPVKGLDYNGAGTAVWLGNSIIFAVNKGARIINMSWGVPLKSVPFLDEALDFASASGVILVAAAGNDSTLSSWHYPANRADVIAVGSLAPDFKLSSFSNFGPKNFVTAPGSEILSLKLNCDICKLIEKCIKYYKCPILKNDYLVISGTSMATPHVSGLIGLMISRNPSLTPLQVKSILNKYSQDLGEPGRDNTFGAGLIDAEAAVLNSISPPPVSYNPFQPSISGPTEAHIGDISEYTINLDDPDNDQKKILIMWHYVTDKLIDVFKVPESLRGFKIMDIPPGAKEVKFSTNWRLSKYIIPTQPSYAWRVIVQVFDASGNASPFSETLSVKLLKPRPLTVSCSTNIQEAYTDQPIEFTAIADGGVTPYKFEWGGVKANKDWKKCTGNVCVNSFFTTGQKSVKVTVTDDNFPNPNKITATCKVNIKNPPRLDVSCEALPNPAKKGEQVTFYSTVKGGIPPYSYSWTEACSGNSENCTKIFEKVGDYKANLKVIDSLSQKKETSCQVKVKPN
jgi:subtilisin family serine protease